MTEPSSARAYAVGEVVQPDAVSDDEPLAMGQVGNERSRTLRFIVAGIAVAVALSLLLVSARLDLVRASYALAAEERTAERLLEEKRHMVVERASLRSPGRLAMHAAAQSMLVRPEVEQWVRWPEIGRVDRWPW